MKADGDFAPRLLGREATVRPMCSLVVTVSGPSGAGKSTLVGDLSERLRGLGLCVETVHLDDFTSESDRPRGDVLGWVARGGPPGE